MKISICTIAGGNPTLIFRNAEAKRRRLLSKISLRIAEQSGFVDTGPECVNPSLTMMGGELSVNGTLAACSLFPDRNRLDIYGISGSVSYSMSGSVCVASLPLQYKISAGCVLFETIGYTLVDPKKKITKQDMRILCNRFTLPAFGILRSVGNVMLPVVYVRETDSFVYETSCGSGSIALSLLTGKTDIRQTTGKYIRIEKFGNTFSVRAEIRSFTYDLPLYKNDPAGTI
jgi:hypothetical protein